MREGGRREREALLRKNTKTDIDNGYAQGGYYKNIHGGNHK